MKRVFATAMVLAAVVSLAVGQTNSPRLPRTVEIKATSSRTAYVQGIPAMDHEGKVEVRFFRHSLQADKVAVYEDPNEPRHFVLIAEGNITTTRSIYITENGVTSKLRDVVETTKSARIKMEWTEPEDER